MEKGLGDYAQAQVEKAPLERFEAVNNDSALIIRIL